MYDLIHFSFSIELLFYFVVVVVVYILVELLYLCPFEIFISFQIKYTSEVELFIPNSVLVIFDLIHFSVYFQSNY